MCLEKYGKIMEDPLQADDKPREFIQLLNKKHLHFFQSLFFRANFT
jgi:hypothetical protein